MKHFISFIATCLLAGVMYGQDFIPGSELPLFLNPAVRTGTLPNGLKYYIMENKKPEKRMELRLAVNTGSTMEEENQRGLAHFVEHMAFNGTKNFKKNELVDYLESIGTKFGPHLNAYTSFDETVYMMQVPTDSQEQFKKAFQILEDWAGGLAFDPKEIDKERGVVIEEWRLGQGAFERMRNQYWPALFRGSRYETRLPIGDKKILETAPYERLISFYKDWYRPNNMAVIAVGDFDGGKVEEEIKEHFSKLKNPEKQKPVKKWEVPDMPAVEVITVEDKEAPYTMIEILYKHPVDSVNIEGDYRRRLTYDLYNRMMASRLEELTNQSDPPFTYASTQYGNLVRNKNAYMSFAIVKDNGVRRGLEALMDENERVRRHGFTPMELEREKKQLIRELEKRMAELEKTESSKYARSLVSYFLEGDPFPGATAEMFLYNKYLNGILVDDINWLARAWINNKGRNCVVIVQSPDKEGLKKPEAGAIKIMFEGLSKRTVGPYNDVPSPDRLLLTKPVAGTIITEKHNDEFGYTELKLSNGATVVYKQTDFKNDEIQFRAMSWGGSSLYPVSDDASASEAGGIIEKSGLGYFDKNMVDRYSKGKILNVRTYISETSENMQGSTSPQDLDAFMQMIHLYFKEPRKDSVGFSSYMDQQKSFVENRKLDPGNAYRDTIDVTMAGYHPRRRPWTLDLLREVKHDRAFSIYKERFSNAGDFTFYFIGNFDTAMLKSYINNYIGSLPSTGKAETWKDVGVNTPTGVIKKTVRRGVEPKSTVTMKFSGPATYSGKENMDMKALIKLMNIKLREILREEKGGTYGVSCYGYISRIPKTEYLVSIQFGCAPENTDNLTKSASEVLKTIAEKGCDDKDLTKIKETFRRERETNLKENGWWLNNLVQYYAMGDPLPSQKDFDTYFANLKSEDFKQAASKYLNMNNYAYFVLVPETE